MDLFADLTSQVNIISNKVKMDSYTKAKNRGIKIRIITEITSECLPYSKKLMQFVEVGHIDGIIGVFGVDEKES